jgi:hypothetical protein
MSSLHITEFRGMMAGPSGGVPVPYGMLASQELTINTEVDSAAFNASTRVVRVWAEAACHIAWGAPEQTSTTAKMPLGAGESYHFGVDSGDEISVIAA